ncbi:MAG TPA: glycosyltransferase [Solirubrobacteraceae bacterium]|nr:glycosyltransferase [Solirubrobacteraceae bacterium]
MSPLLPKLPLQRLPRKLSLQRFTGHRALKALAIVYVIVLFAAVISYKAAFIDLMFSNVFFGVYSISVASYILSRFLFSLFYRSKPEAGVQPQIAIVMPGFNEEEAIADSLLSLLALEYPREKLELVAVNDGSTDGTLAEMQRVAAAANGRVNVIDFPQNRGKRAAMAAGIRATSAEVIVFVDSDSVVEPDALHLLVQPLADPRVGAVCGHANVQNVRESWLTRMQAVRYFVAFRVVKAAESVFNAVTCCSGCFSAYRREAILPRLEWWESQTFMGVESTFGDDRSLTNCVLRDWRVVYEKKAISHTIVPSTFRSFVTQQTRWKRSWTRESLMVAKFIWRKHPIAALFTYMSIVLPLIAPIAALHAIVWNPLMHDSTLPLTYLAGIYALALVYSLYYVLFQEEYNVLWLYGILFVFFYLAIMLWQTYYAIATCRTASWGTRPATAGLGGDGGGP